MLVGFCLFSAAMTSSYVLALLMLKMSALNFAITLVNQFGWAFCLLFGANCLFALITLMSPKKPSTAVVEFIVQSMQLIGLVGSLVFIILAFLKSGGDILLAEIIPAITTSFVGMLLAGTINAAILLKNYVLEC